MAWVGRCRYHGEGVADLLGHGGVRVGVVGARPVADVLTVEDVPSRRRQQRRTRCGGEGSRPFPPCARPGSGWCVAAQEPTRRGGRRQVRGPDDEEGVSVGTCPGGEVFQQPHRAGGERQDVGCEEQVHLADGPQVVGDP